MGIARMVGAALLVLVLSGCPRAGNSELDRVNDFAIQLEEFDPAAAGMTAFDLLITDYSSDGTEEGRWTADDIARLKQSPGGPKLVLAYLSVGEARDFRWYWDPDWDADEDGEPDPGAPAWLADENPDWPGNYAVRYWDPDWQAVLAAYLDDIIAAGYDGVYLDRVEAYEYWGPDGESDEERLTAEEDMVELVKSLAVHARAVMGAADFIVIPHNAEELGEHRSYLNIVDGIGREDVFFFDDALLPGDEVEYITEDLDRFRNAGKIVLVTDYCTQAANVDSCYELAEERGYVPYVTTRELDFLTVNLGHEPD